MYGCVWLCIVAMYGCVCTCMRLCDIVITIIIVYNTMIVIMIRVLFTVGGHNIMFSHALYKHR